MVEACPNISDIAFKFLLFVSSNVVYVCLQS